MESLNVTNMEAGSCRKWKLIKTKTKDQLQNKYRNEERKMKENKEDEIQHHLIK